MLGLHSITVLIAADEKTFSLSRTMHYDIKILPEDKQFFNLPVCHIVWQ